MISEGEAEVPYRMVENVIHTDSDVGERPEDSGKLHPVEEVLKRVNDERSVNDDQDDASYETDGDERLLKERRPRIRRHDGRGGGTKTLLDRVGRRHYSSACTTTRGRAV